MWQGVTETKTLPPTKPRLDFPGALGRPETHVTFLHVSGFFRIRSGTFDFNTATYTSNPLQTQRH